MHIERIQIEEGFLDGLDIRLVPGLNVVIGARGTGKSSLIELVCFCLGVKGYNNESTKRSRDHAISVLSTGQVTVTPMNGPQKITVSRTISEDAPRASAPFPSPIIFSQTEIEAVGLQPGGRLQLLDGFVRRDRRGEAAEAEAVSTVRSLTSEAETIRREIDELGRQIAALPTLDQQLAELAPKEQQLAKLSAETGEKKKGLDTLSGTIAASSVAAAATERFSAAISRWRNMVASVMSGTPTVEAWPKSAGPDPLPPSRARVAQARKHIQAALDELGHAMAEAGEAARSAGQTRITLDDMARQLRIEIESPNWFEGRCQGSI
jgi:DNA repair ATPase RecN